MKPNYIVIGREEIFYNSDCLKDCKTFIDRTTHKHPSHIELTIYKLFKENEADLNNNIMDSKAIYNGW